MKFFRKPTLNFYTRKQLRLYPQEDFVTPGTLYLNAPFSQIAQKPEYPKAGVFLEAGSVLCSPASHGFGPWCAPVRGKPGKPIQQFKRGQNQCILPFTHQEAQLPGVDKTSKSALYSHQRLLEKVFHSGLSRLGLPGLPTQMTENTLEPHQVKHVLLSYLVCEPYQALPPYIFERDNTRILQESLLYLGQLYPQAVFHLIFPREQKKLFSRIKAGVSATVKLVWHPFSSKYPEHYPHLLYKGIFKEKLPNYLSIVDQKTLLLDAVEVYQLWETLAFDLPTFLQYIFLGGPSWKKNQWLRLLPGTSLAEIKKAHLDSEESLLIENSLLTGTVFSEEENQGIGFKTKALLALPHSNTREFLEFLRPGPRAHSYSRTFLSSLSPIKPRFSFDSKKHGEERACVSCGFCAQVCPAGIYPQLLYLMIQQGIFTEKLIQHGLFQCLSCNACSYVCPSKLPLASSLEKGMGELLQQGRIQLPQTEHSPLESLLKAYRGPQ